MCELAPNEKEFSKEFERIRFRLSTQFDGENKKFGNDYGDLKNHQCNSSKQQQQQQTTKMSGGSVFQKIGKFLNIKKNNKNCASKPNHDIEYNQRNQHGQDGAYGTEYESKMADVSEDKKDLDRYSGFQWYCMIDVENVSNSSSQHAMEKMYWSAYPSNIQKQLFIAWKKFCVSPNPSTSVAHIVLQGRHYRVIFMKDQICKAKPCAFQMSDSGLSRQVRLDKPDKNGNIWGVGVLTN